MKPLISVVIPAFNEASYLGALLETLQQQDYPLFEVIVVDNNSTDRTAEIAKKFGAKVVSEAIPGVACARQTGCLAASGEILAMTDADTRVPSNWLSQIAARFSSDPRIVAVGGLYKLYSGPRFSKLLFPHIAYWLWKLDAKINQGWSLPGANMAVKKEVFNKIGGFNTELKILEDVDLTQRLKCRGQVVLDKKLLVSTSGRRYRNGLLGAVLTYIPNIFTMIAFKKATFNRLKPVRKDSVTLVAKATPLILSSVLFLAFSVAAPAKAERLENYSLRKIHRPVSSVNHFVKKERPRVSSFAHAQDRK